MPSTPVGSGVIVNKLKLKIMLNGKKIESVQSVQLNVVGLLNDELQNWTSSRLSKSGFALNLFRGEGEDAEIATLVFSKNLSAALANKEITLEQVKHCQIIDGTNAQNEQRYYLVLPSEFSDSINCATWAAANVAAPKRKAFALPKATTAAAQPML